MSSISSIESYSYAPNQSPNPPATHTPSQTQDSDAVRLTLSNSKDPTINEREKHYSDYERGKGYLSQNTGQVLSQHTAEAGLNLSPEDSLLYGSYQSALNYRERSNLGEATYSLSKVLKYFR